MGMRRTGKIRLESWSMVLMMRHFVGFERPQMLFVRLI